MSTVAWRELSPADLARVIDPHTNGGVQVVNDHERFLLANTSYTKQEREQVVGLCDEERAAIRDYCFGGDVNLIQERFRIASERVKISRAARRRGVAK